MASIMFEKPIAAKFRSGKGSTIRGLTKNPGGVKPGIRPGAVVSLRIWAGKAYRSANVEFGTATVDRIQSVEFTDQNCEVDGVRLTAQNFDALAVRDGFQNRAKFIDWFTKRLNPSGRLFFTGKLIVFRDINLNAMAAMLADVLEQE